MDDLFPFIKTSYIDRRHEAPPPASGPEQEEWAFNHLPLTEKQKEAFLADMIKEQLVKEKKSKAEKSRVRVKREDITSTCRKSVKEWTKE